MSMQFSKEYMQKMKRPDLAVAQRLQELAQEEFKRVTGLDDISLPQTATAENPKRVSAEAARSYPEISLKEEFDQQVGSMVELAASLEISRDKCLGMLPSGFPERKPSYGELAINVPFLVPQFPGVPWLKVVEAAGFGVSDYLRENASKLSVWKDNRGIALPDGLYGTWAHIGDRYWNCKPSAVRRDMSVFERGGTHWDGLALAVLHPEVLKDKWFDLVGSQVGSARVPAVRWWPDRPKFYARLTDLALPHYRALVCGR